MSERKVSRERGTNLTVKRSGRVQVKESKTRGMISYAASAGPYTDRDENGSIVEGISGMRGKINAIRNAAAGSGRDKHAGMFNDGSMGFADIMDSNNMGYYSYEFPVDALEMPASRAEEIRFYRLAYDRDPIVGRAIDLHTELPMSKCTLEKPKCSVEEFSDYVFDWYQGLINDSKFFQTLIEAVREWWTIGEAFLYVEEPAGDPVELCAVAKKFLKGGRRALGTSPLSESENAPYDGGNVDKIMKWMEPSKRSSLLKKASVDIQLMASVGISFDPEAEDLAKVASEIEVQKLKVSLLSKKIAKVISREGNDDHFNFNITAAPGDPAMDQIPTEDETSADEDAEGVDEGAPLGEGGMDDISLPPSSGGFSGGGFSGGGGLGGGSSEADETKNALAMAGDIEHQRALMEAKHYLKLLEKKEELLNELLEIRKQKNEEEELFGHVTNSDYEGFEQIQVLPPEQIEISNEGGLGESPEYWYKPPENTKAAYLNSESVSNEIKDVLQEKGSLPLNTDPYSGSYLIHFARKKSGYELHGRSILQRCMRTCIYREKLRQVQSTLASRNMTPKRLIIAPGIPASEVLTLRAHIDEAVADPDYTVVVNYECTWNEIGSEGRLLALDSEWQHTNSDLAIGLGFSPEILIGEGMYSGNRIQMEIMNTIYVQFRENITGIIENEIFKPLAMKKGFYEMDKYGRPRWIYPKINFSRMALRDSGDLFDCLYNMYAKGSLPVSVIYEFLNLDAETIKRQLEDDLFTVNDSKMGDAIANMYSQLAEKVIAGTDIAKRVAKGLTLDEIAEDSANIEGSGEGV
jgi:hypothetical protein